MRLVALTLVAALAACSGRAPRELPLSLEVTHERGGVVLTLRPQHGLKINALLLPQLELANGDITRFGAPAHPVTVTDSAYFTEPPMLVVPAGASLAGAQVRASVCDSDAAVCRVLTIPL